MEVRVWRWRSRVFDRGEEGSHRDAAERRFVLFCGKLYSTGDMIWLHL